MSRAGSSSSSPGSVVQRAAEERHVARLSAVIDAPPATVWMAVRAFGDVYRWHPLITESRIVAGEDGMEGAERELTLKDGGKVREKLTHIDDAHMELRYRMMTFPIPVWSQENAIRVTGNRIAGTSTVVFEAEFVPADGHNVGELRELNVDVFKRAAMALQTHVASTPA